MSTTTFGAYIRECRVKAGRSIRSVAAELGISHVYLVQAEHGQCALAEKHWPALSERIGADMDRMRYLSEPPEMRALRDEVSSLRARLAAVGQALTATV